MPILKLLQVIERPVDEVFAAVVDVANFPNWNPTTKSARKISVGETGNGTKFELEIRGFGTVPQELAEFERNKRVRLVPQMKSLGGGHRFLFSAQGTGTRIDHELEMSPKGFFRLFGPLIGAIGRKNLRATANALKAYLERPRNDS